MARARDDDSRYGFPPAAEPWTPFPDATPWDVPIVELVAFSLEAECKCGTTFTPLRLMAANLGWTATLRSIVPRLRCSRCAEKPALVLLVSSSSGERKRSGSTVRWHQLLPALR